MIRLSEAKERDFVKEQEFPAGRGKEGNGEGMKRQIEIFDGIITGRGRWQDNIIK